MIGCMINWDDVTLLVTPNDGRRYSIRYTRAKNTMPHESDFEYQLITGIEEVRILDEYIQCFPKKTQEGRFFRKLCVNNFNNTICVKSIQAIGQNSIAKNFHKKLQSSWENWTGKSIHGIHFEEHV